MLSDDAQVFRRLQHGRTLLGEGWKCVESFDEVNEDTFEDDEEEEYVLMDLGTSVDTRTLQTEATYQLVGLDTAMPFLKIGENVFEGRIAPLIGDEVVFDIVHQEESQRPHYRPLLKTNQRVEFRGISLIPRGTGEREKKTLTPKIAGALDRGMFPSRPRRLPKPAETEGDIAKGEEKARAKSTSPVKNKGNGKQVDPAAPMSTPIRRSGRTRGPIAPTVADLTADAAPGHTITLTTGGYVDETPQAKTEHEEATPADVMAVDDPGTPGMMATPTLASTARRGGPGRPRGRQSTGTPRMVRAAVAVATLSDLADIAYAGGLGDGHVRLDVAPNADDELLAAVSAVRRGAPWTPGSRLTPAQEVRLLRNLPASGPGSRGGRRPRGKGRGGRVAGRRRTVDASGEGLGDEFFGIGAEEKGDDEDEGEGQAGPSNSRKEREGEQGEGGARGARGVAEEEEVDELDDDQVMAEPRRQEEEREEEEEDEDEMEVDAEISGL